MKNIAQIKLDIAATGQIVTERPADEYLNGFLTYHGTQFFWIFSWGLDWEHLSVSTKKRCPTWEEMCLFKDLFWFPDETVMQLHPARDVYRNHHPNCLHLWKPLKEVIPTPPAEMVAIA